MQHDELMSLKETGQKGDFLLPYVVSKTVLPDYYTTFPMHWHEEMEIVYVEDGEFTECVDFEEYHVQKGDIVMVAPSVLHSFRQLDEKRARFRTIVFDLKLLTGNHTDACSIKYFLPFESGQYLAPVIISSQHPSYQELRTHLLNMIALYDEQQDYFELKLKAEFYELFCILFREVFVSDTAGVPLRDATTKNIRQILNYINENYMNNITVE